MGKTTVKVCDRLQSSAALKFLALIVLLSMICEVSSWSSHPKTTTSSFLSSSTSCSDTTLSSERPNILPSSPTSRRSVLSTAAWNLVLAETAALAGNPIAAHAAEETSFLYTRNQSVLNKKNLSYQISIPITMKEGSKPVKTHLDEVNFVSDSVKRYQYGITVDPVRISSLKEFGTPEEVAARVVTAEVNRDGIFEVTLLKDPYKTETNDDEAEAYILQYLSVGKRGNKILTNKIVVSSNQLLYVLTAQCKQEDFSAQEREIMSTVESFRVS
eukprot:CAMPEP_0197188448 /NCGR_PEP_ID=MMETSP1423-20130617/17814_1 /TAXON_ID=476441 /ORGANISM="Pseudo-nitzschia heimii, Strain UNC1101" /LENGTH=271 /DNA_ID=CAMNT_0042640281 /DNA_START=146 /DNA_END=961 /DNA_ORIENTATION=-